MKKEVNPAMIIGAVVVLLIVVFIYARKTMSNGGGGENPYKNAPQGFKPPGSGGPGSTGASMGTAVPGRSSAPGQ